MESAATLAQLPQMLSAAVTKGATTTYTGPIETVRFIKAVLPNKGGIDADGRYISNGIAKAINKDPNPVFIPGSAPLFPGGIKENQTYTLTPAEQNALDYVSGNKTARMEITLRVVRLNIAGTGARTHFWQLVNTDAIKTTFNGTWNENERFTVRATLFDGAPIDYIFEVNPRLQVSVPATTSAERNFDRFAGIAEVSHYGSLFSTSADSNPEHEVTYVNEVVVNDPARNGKASYTGCAMAGLKLRGNPNLSQLEQLYLYQKKGIHVKKLRQGKPESEGPSSIFTDLVYFLLTDKNTGMGNVISEDLIDKEQLARTGSFLEANHLYFDDVIVDTQNIRDFFARISSSLLCNLVTRRGKFSIEPALPIDNNFKFTDVPTPISGIFTEGNIIEDSFSLEYVPLQERTPIRALVRYRTESPNRFPQENTVVVYYKNEPNGPLEEFNFTHITSRYHAELFAKFLLSSRRHRTHAVSFKTLPYGLNLAPGDYIRVVTRTNYTKGIAAGVISANGEVLLPRDVEAGTYDVFYWDKANQDVKEGQLTLIANPDGSSGLFTNSMRNTIFTIKPAAVNADNQIIYDKFSKQSQNYDPQVYSVDSIDVDEDGLVQITASFFPVNFNRVSLIAEELKSSYTGFAVVADLSPD